MEKKTRTTLSMILTVLGLGLCGSCIGNYINPILQKLIDMYPHIPVSTVRSLSSMTSLLSIGVSLPLTLFWGNRVKIKNVMIIASVLACCGMLPALFETPPFIVLVISRACLGVAFGLNMMRNAAIKKIFASDVVKMTAWLGYLNMVFNFSNIIAPKISGPLGDMNVRYVFLMYGVGIIALLVNLFILDIPNDGVAEAAAEEKPKLVIRFEPGVIFHCVAIMIVTVVSFTINTASSTYVVARGFGEATAAGTIASFYSIGCLIGSTTNGWWHKHVPTRFCLAVDMFLCALGFLVVVFAPSLTVAGIGAAILGIGFTYNYLINIVWAGEAASIETKTFALTLTTVALSLGSYLSSYWITLANAMGKLMPFLSSDAERSYLAAAVVYLVLMVGLLAVDPRPKSLKAAKKAE